MGTCFNMPLSMSCIRACLTGSFKWYDTGIGLCLALGTASCFRWIYVGLQDMAGNCSSVLNAELANCSSNHFSDSPHFLCLLERWG